MKDMSDYQKPRHHEWRWQNLVEPLVDKDGTDRMFLDLGCNAGWYMRKAQRLGYKTLGLEQDPNSIAKSPDLDIIQGDVNYYNPHCAYLTLLACVHYHQTPEQVEALFHNLSDSTAYLLVMGRNNVNGRVVSNPKIDHLIKNVLEGWDVLDKRDARAFYTVLLKNRRYEELPVEDLYLATRDFTLNIEGFDDFVPAFQDFVRRSLDDMNWNPENSQFMDYLKRRKFPYKLGRCWLYKKMIQDLQKRGPHTALKVKGNRIEDGYHRLVILRELGVKRVVCRVRGATRHGLVGG